MDPSPPLPLPRAVGARASLAGSGDLPMPRLLWAPSLVRAVADPHRQPGSGCQSRCVARGAAHRSGRFGRLDLVHVHAPTALFRIGRRPEEADLSRLSVPLKAMNSLAVLGSFRSEPSGPRSVFPASLTASLAAHVLLVLSLVLSHSVFSAAPNAMRPHSSVVRLAPLPTWRPAARTKPGVNTAATRLPEQRPIAGFPVFRPPPAHALRRDAAIVMEAPPPPVDLSATDLSLVSAVPFAAMHPPTLPPPPFKTDNLASVAHVTVRSPERAQAGIVENAGFGAVPATPARSSQRTSRAPPNLREADLRQPDLQGVLCRSPRRAIPFMR